MRYAGQEHCRRHPAHAWRFDPLERNAMSTPYSATVRAPEFPPDLEWFNTRPLSLADLRGKLVLLDFWTYG